MQSPLKQKEKIRLARKLKAALSESRLSRMWAEQTSKKIPYTETNTRGLKRKLFNPEGGINKSGRMDTICVCPADRIRGIIVEDRQHPESKGR